MSKAKTNQKSQVANAHITSSRQIPVVFTLEHLTAKKVYLCGDFNQWSPMTLRMLPSNGSGSWEKRLTLPSGRVGKWSP
jgi:1,4-alpha-glucan branching enzyme